MKLIQYDEEYIISKLQELGITAIKGIFITHSHDDHIGNTNKLIELRREHYDNSEWMYKWKYYLKINEFLLEMRYTTYM